MVDPITNRLERYLDTLSARQKLVASNVANADTPGYKTRDIDFQSAYEGALSGSSITSIEVSGLKIRNDGNNVSLERESRLLAENAIRFSFASQLVRSQYRILKSAIDEGKSS